MFAAASMFLETLPALLAAANAASCAKLCIEFAICAQSALIDSDQGIQGGNA